MEYDVTIIVHCDQDEIFNADWAPEGKRVDEIKSTQKYAQMVENALSQEYPDARIEVRYQFTADGQLCSNSVPTRVDVYPRHHGALLSDDETDALYQIQDSYDIQQIDEVCEKIWMKGDWVVCADRDYDEEESSSD
jgi:hypothetical protein